MKILELLAENKLTEGVHDPAIFKSVFVIGGPGSGKSSVSELLGLKAMGFVSVNSDEAFTHLLQKAKLSLKMPPEEEEKRSAVRTRAKEITATKFSKAIDGRLGIIIDGTGEDFRKVNGIHENLRGLGYESYLVVVYANLETAKRRNAARPRSIPEDVLEKKWFGVQNNLDDFLTSFDNSLIIDNNGTIKDLKPQIDHAYKALLKWSTREPATPEAKQWISDKTGNHDIEDVEDTEIPNEKEKFTDKKVESPKSTEKKEQESSTDNTVSIKK